MNRQRNKAVFSQFQGGIWMDPSFISHPRPRARLKGGLGEKKGGRREMSWKISLPSFPQRWRREGGKFHFLSFKHFPWLSPSPLFSIDGCRRSEGAFKNHCQVEGRGWEVFVCVKEGNFICQTPPPSSGGCGKGSSVARSSHPNAAVKLKFCARE